jgi:hypothetical protein
MHAHTPVLAVSLAIPSLVGGPMVRSRPEAVITAPLSLPGIVVRPGVVRLPHLALPVLPASFVPAGARESAPAAPAPDRAAGLRRLYDAGERKPARSPAGSEIRGGRLYPKPEDELLRELGVPRR